MSSSGLCAVSFSSIPAACVSLDSKMQALSKDFRVLTLRVPRATLVNKNFLPLSTNGNFSRHKEWAVL